MRRIGAVRRLGWLLVTALVASGLTACSPPGSLGYVQRTDAGLQMVTCYKGEITQVTLGPGRAVWEYSGEPAVAVALPSFSEGEYHVWWSGPGGGGDFTFDSNDVNGDIVGYAGGAKTKREVFGFFGYLSDCEHKP